jgi:hypothetical protein
MSLFGSTVKIDFIEPGDNLMNLPIWPIIILGMLIATQTSSSQNKKAPAKTDATQERTSTRQFGKSYATLRPEQKRLVDDYVRRYNETTNSKIVAQQGYDAARVSIRTTFDAVTHALIRAKLTDANGKSLGRAFDLVDAIDEIMREAADVGGDRQFRAYVYLKPKASEILSRSREFHRERDNTVYHKGFPICFRLKNGPPSIQISISRDQHIADIDVDYRSSSFPKALFNGHLTAANSDVRAGDNLDRHDNRWSGLNGWWRELFGSFGGTKFQEDKSAGGNRNVPLNPRVKANQGIDESAHDFLKSWVVDRQPKNAIAYFSRRSYACLEAIARKNRKPISPGMVRVRIRLSMESFIANVGTVKSVEEVFEPADQWSPALKQAKNAYGGEFRLVNLPPDAGQDAECVAIPDDETGKKHMEKYYATAFRAKQGDSRNKVMSLLWAEEGKYWKIVAIRIEDSNNAGITPKSTASAPPVQEAEPKIIAGNSNAVKDITDFYQTWLIARDTLVAGRYASERSYACMGPPSQAEKKMKPADRIRAGLKRPLERIPTGQDLSKSMSSVQPVNELVRPVGHQNSNAFAIMAVPEQMADSFLCQNRRVTKESPELRREDAKYGSYYLSASHLNLGEEESPALLLLWTQEKERWKVVAWAVEVP